MDGAGPVGAKYLVPGSSIIQVPGTWLLPFIQVPGTWLPLSKYPSTRYLAPTIQVPGTWLTLDRSNGSRMCGSWTMKSPDVLLHVKKEVAIIGECHCTQLWHLIFVVTVTYKNNGQVNGGPHLLSLSELHTVLNSLPLSTSYTILAECWLPA